MYLTYDELVELNRIILETTCFEGDRPHGVTGKNDLDLIARLAQTAYPYDPIRRATFLCCGIIAYHPYQDGNHRTSLFAGMRLLLLNGYLYRATLEEQKAMYRWRFQHESEHNLEGQWAYYAPSWDARPGSTNRFIRNIVESEYGRAIEAHYREFCVPYPIAHGLAVLPVPHGGLNAFLRRYPPSFRKEVRRVKRSMRRTIRDIQAQLERATAQVPSMPKKSKGPPAQPWADR